MHGQIVLILGYEEWTTWRQTHDLAYLLAIALFSEDNT